MKRKLTLAVDEMAVAKAKRLARSRGVSVSSLFEQWSLRAAAGEIRPSLGSRLRGRWKEPADEDARFDYLMEKHGR